MENRITVDAQNTASFFGPLASRYSYTPALRTCVDQLYESAMRSNNRFFVLDGETVKAAQSTEAGAIQYMQPGYVFVEVENPVTGDMIEQARQMWQHVPFRRCWVAVKDGTANYILKATAHTAGKYARQGYYVVELHRA
jgi:hypothetical protein